tara:strand:- start:168 stop:587 length:420 start_codon:yes stop_codon:yes gene_type:complete
VTIIDWINQVLIHKKPWDSFSEEDQKTFNTFIINRWLSMDKEFCEYINMFQPYSIGMLESKDVYEFYRNLLPKGKRFNKYIKGKKDKKYDKELLEILSKHFEESKLNVKSYIDLIGKDELIDIVKSYGIEDKKIKRMIK